MRATECGVSNNRRGNKNETNLVVLREDARDGCKFCDDEGGGVRLDRVVDWCIIAWGD
jgi:hypothetical protein